MKKPLAQIPRGSEALGRRTIMDRALAMAHGVRYVHLAVFSIDVDRVRDERESLDEELPFAWEVFLTEAYLLRTLDPEDEDVRAMLDDTVAAIGELPPSDEGVLGTQLPFAVWHAAHRGVWPRAMEKLFSSWKERPRSLGKELDTYFAEPDGGEARQRELARLCLETEIQPPLAAPTREALERLAGG